MNGINSVDGEWLDRVLLEYLIDRLTGFNFDCKMRFIVTD